jgi:hypothetical protein
MPNFVPLFVCFPANWFVLVAWRSGDRGGHETGMFLPMLWRGRASEETCLCIAGYGGPIVWDMKHYKESRRRGISYEEWKEGKLTGLVTSCIGTDRLKYVSEGKIEGSIEVTARWGRRRKKLFDDLKEKRGYRKLKEAALDRRAKNSLRSTLWTCRKTDSRINWLVN